MMWQPDKDLLMEMQNRLNKIEQALKAEMSRQPNSMAQTDFEMGWSSCAAHLYASFFKELKK